MAKTAAAIVRAVALVEYVQAGPSGLRSQDDKTDSNVKSAAFGDACTSGATYSLIRVAQACLEQCHHSGICSAINEVADAYVPNSSMRAAQEQVCAHHEAFACVTADAHKLACEKLIRKSASIGLPSSIFELHSECPESESMEASRMEVDNMTVTKTESTLEDQESAEHEASATEQGDLLNEMNLTLQIAENVSSEMQLFTGSNMSLEALSETSRCRGVATDAVNRMAPHCLQQCESKGVCSAVNNAVNAYLPRHNEGAAWHQVCSRQAAFECLLEDAWHTCGKVIAKAAKFGLPTSASQLRSKCR